MEEIPPLDEAAMAAAGELVRARRAPGGSFGRLEELACWWAGVRGLAQPGAPRRPRLLVVTGQHGIAEAGVSTLPPDWPAVVAAGLRTGDLPQAELARTARVSGRVVDAGILAGHPGPWGRLDLTDAVPEPVAAAALAAGRRLADAEIDAGTDLVLLGDAAVGSTTAAAVCVAAVTGNEPVSVVGRGSGLDDAGWMRKAAAVRDGLWRVSATNAQWEPQRLLGVAGGADLAVLTGVCLQAATRRTAVLLDGAVGACAALLAELVSPGVARFLQAGGAPDEPAGRLALERLGLTPLLDLGVVPGAGTAALVAYPLLRTATLLAGAAPADAS